MSTSNQPPGQTPPPPPVPTAARVGGGAGRVAPSRPSLRGASFYQGAAKLSWALPLILAFGGVLVRNAGSAAAVTFDMLRILAAFVAFVAAVVALFGVKRFGTKGILTPALIGLILNGLLLVIAGTNFLAAYSRARAKRNAAAQASAQGGGV